MMPRTHHRLTVRGSDALEASLEELLRRIADVTSTTLGPGVLRSLVLLGGYGRGEGGVDRSDGSERPHNNLDLLLITRGRGRFDGSSARAHGARLSEALQPLARDAGIGIDVGAIADGPLSRARCLVMWSDMRQGHRVVAGDPSFVASLEQFEPRRIEAEDVLALLVNRATLLVINRALLAQGEPTEEQRRTIVRHGMKAIVGAGDALLFTKGLYDGSYLEKRSRLLAAADASPELQRRYDEAIEFRLEPNYAQAPRTRRALETWNRELVSIVSSVHAECEAQRLGGAASTAWEGYFGRALVAAARRPTTIKDAARRLRDGLRFRDVRALPRLARLALRTLGWREVLPLVFPLVAYGEDCATAAHLLGVAGANAAAIDLAYLRAWATFGDPSFASVARHLELRLASDDRFASVSAKTANDASQWLPP